RRSRRSRRCSSSSRSPWWPARWWSPAGWTSGESCRADRKAKAAIPLTPTKKGSRMEFANQVVMLTGAGGRLGRPCALAFAAEGARLLLTDSAASTLEETARLARVQGATVVAAPGDVTRRADVEAALAEGRRQLGPVDVLVNFAGYVPVSSVLEVSEAEWDRVFAVHVK